MGEVSHGVALPIAGKARRTLTDIRTAELGEFVTGHAFFVNRQPRQNGTLSPFQQPANLQLAKNGRNKWINADSLRVVLSRRTGTVIAIDPVHPQGRDLCDEGGVTR